MADAVVAVMVAAIAAAAVFGSLKAVSVGAVRRLAAAEAEVEKRNQDAIRIADPESRP